LSSIENQSQIERPTYHAHRPGYGRLTLTYDADFQVSDGHGTHTKSQVQKSISRFKRYWKQLTDADGQTDGQTDDIDCFAFNSRLD